MFEIGNLGGVTKTIGGIVGIALAAIVLFTFAPIISGDVDQIAIQNTRACVLADGERFTWLSPAFTAGQTADQAWEAATTATAVTIPATSTACTLATAGAANNTYYTPKGTVMTEAASSAISPTATATAPSPSLTALAGGSLVALLMGVMGILLPAGALGFLGYTGAMLVRSYVGGSPIVTAITATVAVVIIASILPSVFTPLDTFYLAISGPRYYVFNTGLGKLSGILAEFMGLALIAGVVTLGALLWKGRKGADSVDDFG